MPVDATTSTKYFAQYKPMLDQAARAASRKYRIPFEETQANAYLLFCEAIERYDETKASFSTFLTWRLQHLNAVCVKERGLKYDGERQVAARRRVVEFDDRIHSHYVHYFEDELDKLESALELSQDAQDVLEFILGREWDIPSVSRWKPKLASTARWFEFDRGWTFGRCKAAWHEIRTWWNAKEAVA